MHIQSSVGAIVRPERTRREQPFGNPPLDTNVADSGPSICQGHWLGPDVGGPMQVRDISRIPKLPALRAGPAQGRLR